LDWWHALILGLIEGITEYLPVSSTGHLLVAQRLLGIPEGEAANAFAIAIQAGAIAAVVGLYRVRCRRLLLGLVGGDEIGTRFCVRLIFAFLPAALLGLLFEDVIEHHLFGPWPIVIAWTVGGLVILLFAQRITRRGRFELDGLTSRAAILIGLAQCFALWPGTSRSLATILGGLVVGLTLPAAVEFSFLLGLITLGSATIYKAVRSGGVMLDAYGAFTLLVGFTSAWIAAVLAIGWMVRWVSRGGLTIFAWWRLAAAVIVALLASLGRI
jgi:undecaprenyl-diphosphatase